jgi:hypothetical protein
LGRARRSGGAYDSRRSPHRCGAAHRAKDALKRTREDALKWTREDALKWTREDALKWTREDALRC